MGNRPEPDRRELGRERGSEREQATVHARVSPRAQGQDRRQAREARLRRAPKVSARVLELARRNPRLEFDCGITEYFICRALRRETSPEFMATPAARRRCLSPSTRPSPGAPRDLRRTARGASSGDAAGMTARRGRALRMTSVRGRPEPPIRRWEVGELAVKEGLTAREIVEEIEKRTGTPPKPPWTCRVSPTVRRPKLLSPVRFGHALDVRSDSSAA